MGGGSFGPEEITDPGKPCTQSLEQPPSEEGTENPTENQQSWKDIEKADKI